MSGVCKGVLGKTFLNLRALPIKVGDGSNTKVDGYSGVNMAGSNSGPCWPDQDELSWPDVTAIAGSLTPLLEQTSLTKRTRRIFSFSLMQLQHITKIVQPDFITINFMNYMDHSISGKHGVISLVDLETQHPRVASMVYMVNKMQYWANTSLAGQVVAIGTGPHDSDIIRLV
jgi:adenylosuccinate synthase